MLSKRLKMLFQRPYISKSSGGACHRNPPSSSWLLPTPRQKKIVTLLRHCSIIFDLFINNSTGHVYICLSRSVESRAVKETWAPLCVHLACRNRDKSEIARIMFSTCYSAESSLWSRRRHWSKEVRRGGEGRNKQSGHFIFCKALNCFGVCH